MSLLWVAVVWSLLSVLTAAVACVVFRGGQLVSGYRAPDEGGDWATPDPVLATAGVQPL
jgi:hypothetical protein